MVTIQVSGASEEVLADFRSIAALLLGATSAVLLPIGDASNTEKKAGRTKPALTYVASTTAAEPTTAAAAPAPAPAPAPALVPATQKPEDPFHVKLTAELIQKKGVTVTKKVLDSYKVAKASLLAPDQIDAYVKDVEALIVAR